MLDTVAGVEGGEFAAYFPCGHRQLQLRPCRCRLYSRSANAGFRSQNGTINTTGFCRLFPSFEYRASCVKKIAHASPAALFQLLLTPSQGCSDLKRARVQGSPRCGVRRGEMVRMQAHNRRARENRRYTLHHNAAVAPKNFLAASDASITRTIAAQRGMAPAAAVVSGHGTPP